MLDVEVGGALDCISNERAPGVREELFEREATGYDDGVLAVI